MPESAALERLTLPILIGCPGRDAFVDPAATQRLAVRLPNVELVTYPGARHELFMEADAFRDLWFGAIDAFLARHLAAIAPALTARTGS